MDCKIIFGFALGIIGSFIGAWFAHFFSECRRRKEEFNKSATEFKDSFLPEIIFMKHDANIGDIRSADDLSEVLRFGYLHRHLKAFEVFRNYLSAGDKVGIDKAWKQYCYCDEKPEMIFWEKYFTGGRPKSDVEAKKALALERIEGILKFAKHK
jgi:hypothetical protein